MVYWRGAGDTSSWLAAIMEKSRKTERCLWVIPKIMRQKCVTKWPKNHVHVSLIHFNIMTTNMSKPSLQDKFPSYKIFELPHYFWNYPYVQFDCSVGSLWQIELVFTGLSGFPYTDVSQSRDPGSLIRERSLFMTCFEGPQLCTVWYIISCIVPMLLL